jgi:two-component system nitrogen regulation response regulator NtrX
VAEGRDYQIVSEVKTLKEAKEDFEKYYIKRILNSTKGNVSKASEMLDMDRTSLHRKIKALNIAYNS